MQYSNRASSSMGTLWGLASERGTQRHLLGVVYSFFGGGGLLGNKNNEFWGTPDRLDIPQDYLRWRSDLEQEDRSVR